MARFIRGGKRSVYPMLCNDHFMTHDSILMAIQKDRKNIEWLCIADPGSASVFAVLFAAFDHESKKLYLLDELYAETLAETSVGQVMPQIIRKRRDLAKGAEWVNTYDEAAAWFLNEVCEQFPEEIWGPTKKSQRKPEDQLSKIKDLMLKKRFFVSDRCKKWKWEAYNYILDDKGKLPKNHNHLMDCTRYLSDHVQPLLPDEIEETEENDGRPGIPLRHARKFIAGADR